MNKLMFAILLCFMGSCLAEKTSKVYPNIVGDIQFDPEIDDPEFKRCDGYLPYYNGSIDGFSNQEEMGAIIRKVKSSFVNQDYPGQSGFYTIRFLINCKGESGLFRGHAIDHSLKIFGFDNNITSQLDQITEELNGWKIAQVGGRILDYYQYLTFEIVDGHLIDITP